MLRTLARAALTAAFLAAAGLLAAGAHEAPSGWPYPPSCCHGTAVGGDCQMIPREAVRIGPAGYEVTLTPIDHPMVERRIHFTVPYGSERPAPDGEYHVCIKQIEPWWRCFFAGQGST